MNDTTVKGYDLVQSTSASDSDCCESTCCATAEDAAVSDTQNEAVEAAPLEPDRIKAVVRAYYAERAVTGTSCCGSDCGCGSSDDPDRIGAAVGYSEEELHAVPEGANLGLGCGNPTALDHIPAGATVLDLGSGAGFDCFLAARRVGPEGHVIGVDMTPEMVERARANAARMGFEHVEFRLGEIEHLPVASGSVDVLLSNCVINLSPDKPRVFAEAFRVLRPGGRLMVSDLVLSRDLPAFIRQSAEAYAGCIGGAELQDRYLALIEAAGFEDVRVVGKGDYLSATAGEGSLDWLPEAFREQAAEVLQGGSPVVSLQVTATKRVDRGQ